MEVKDSPQKKKWDLLVLNLLKQGKNPSKISKELNLKKQTLQYYLNKFSKRGIIKKKGYGTWEVRDFNSNTLTLKGKSIRGHAFIWTVKLPQEIEDWKDRLKDYKLVRGIIPRAFIQKKKVWFGKKTLTIYEPNSFYGENAIESRKYAVISLVETLEEIERLTKVSLKHCKFSPAREHFALIKNDLAKQVNRNGEKLVVRDDIGDWMWIDFSDGIDELETGNHNALVNNIGVQKWWNDMKETKFEVTPKFVLNSLGQMIQVQQMNADNIVKHQKVLDEMLITLKKIQENLDGKRLEER